MRVPEHPLPLSILRIDDAREVADWIEEALAEFEDAPAALKQRPGQTRQIVSIELWDEDDDVWEMMRTVLEADVATCEQAQNYIM